MAQLEQDYGIRPRAIRAAIASGELYAALGADRPTIEVECVPGGALHTSVLSGTFGAVGPDAVELLTGAGRIGLSVSGSGSTAKLAVDVPDELEPLFVKGLPRLAPGPGRLDAEADERQTYDDWLDFYRGILPAKLAGLSEADARRRLVGSETTLLGLAKHLTFVERVWFQEVMDHDLPEWTPGRGEASFRAGPADTVASVLAGYEQACAASRRIAVRYAMTDLAIDRHGTEISVRMVLTHMIEEIARHAGHADILRELIDGTTGVDPES